MIENYNVWRVHSFMIIGGEWVCTICNQECKQPLLHYLKTHRIRRYYLLAIKQHIRSLYINIVSYVYDKYTKLLWYMAERQERREKRVRVIMSKREKEWESLLALERSITSSGPCVS